MARHASVVVLSLALLPAISVPAAAQSRRAPASATSALEKRVETSIESLRQSPLELRNLLLKMPKGSDLHTHLYGAVNAETWIKDAAEDRMCIDRAAIRGTSAVYSPGAGEPPSCAEGKIPATEVFKDAHLYDDLVDAFSMRGFVPTPGVTAHDHFFDTFSRFNGVSENHLGEWIDEISTRAARQNVQYIELMHTPGFSRTAAAGYEIGWQEDLGSFRDALLRKGVVAEEAAAAKRQIDEAELVRYRRGHCGQGDAAPSCRLEMRYLCQVLRGFPKQQVLAQTILCFETVMADPRFVGVNMVMPEDSYITMTDYREQMRMVGFLHKIYPRVHITLHAGEIAPPLVTYDAMCCHIRLAVEEAGAERIGHGVDVMWEDRPHELLREMAAKHVMVEINLTSNDMILGVTGRNHPFPVYRKFGVPVSFSTDDEGVARIDMTNEYLRAVETYELKYRDLKQMVRTGIEHIFLPGPSLWAAPDRFTVAVDACSGDTLGGEKPSAGCAAFLKSSERARQQWELERRFREFERSL